MIDDISIQVIDKNEHIHLKLFVRYMVSLRCKMIVKQQLKKLNINHKILPYGGIGFIDDVSQNDIDTLKLNLQKHGLDLLNIKETRLIDRSINTIIEVIHYSDELPRLNFSDILAKSSGLTDETSLKLFTEVVGISVIQFIVLHKIERIKELLIYDNLSLSDIANNLNYKNEQTLIAQFKKYTGLTPAFFIELKNERDKIALQINS